MKSEEKLIEHAEFWLTYINDWKVSRDEPIPERALTLLDNALLELKHYYCESGREKHRQVSKRMIH